MASNLPTLLAVALIAIVYLPRRDGELVAAGGSGTCLYQWLRRAGLSHDNSLKHEVSLRSASVTEKSLKSPYFTAFLINVLIKGDMRSAIAIRKCLTRQSKQCRGYNPCQRGGECLFSPRRKVNTCKCRKGLYGDLCQIDCNECSVRQISKCKGLRSNCHVNARCINTPGSFRCACKKGYRGNGRKCIDYDECAGRPQNCSRHAYCKNIVGSYTCTCKKGYTGNGKVCKNACECCSNPCQNGGKCRDHVNRYSCHCTIGYEGKHCEKRWLRTDDHKPLPDAVQNVTKALQDLAEDVKEMKVQQAKTAAELKKLSHNYCKVNPCKYGGTCVDQRNGYLCLCKPGVFGKDCSKAGGRTRYTAGTSCRQLHSSGVHSSGTYWIKYKGRSARTVYCDMSAGGGWMRIVDIDARRKGCPANFQRLTSPKYVCTMTADRTCKSTYFSSFGMAYSEVRGYAYGYQYYSPDGFNPSRVHSSIDQYYVDGISITRGQPRQHVWTFTIGLTQDNARYQPGNCPCAQYPGTSPPSFVGNDYYCDSSNKGSWDPTWYRERLWDGHCYSKSNCCNRSGMPFFLKNLGMKTKDQLEVRICIDQDAWDEKIGLEKMELFVR